MATETTASAATGAAFWSLGDVFAALTTSSCAVLVSTVWADVVELGAAAGAGVDDGVSLDFDEWLVAGAFAGAGSGAGAGVTSGGSTAGVFVVPVLPDVPVVLWALTTTPSPMVWDVELGEVVGDVLGGEVPGVEPGVVASAFTAPLGVVVEASGVLTASAAGGLDAAGLAAAGLAAAGLDVAGLAAGEFEVAELELAGPAEVSSAAATPYPVAIAVPTPNATARAPTRPTYAAAPMMALLMR